jgi:hypothetical protein
MLERAVLEKRLKEFVFRARVAAQSPESAQP